MIWAKDLLLFIAGIFSLLYLLNVGGGILEFLPDNLPFVGNIDEAGAALLLWRILRYFSHRFRGHRDNSES